MVRKNRGFAQCRCRDKQVRCRSCGSCYGCSTSCFNLVVQCVALDGRRFQLDRWRQWVMVEAARCQWFMPLWTNREKQAHEERLERPGPHSPILNTTRPQMVVGMTNTAAKHCCKTNTCRPVQQVFSRQPSASAVLTARTLYLSRPITALGLTPRCVLAAKQRSGPKHMYATAKSCPRQ